MRPYSFRKSLLQRRRAASWNNETRFTAQKMATIPQMVIPHTVKESDCPKSINMRCASPMYAPPPRTNFLNLFKIPTPTPPPHPNTISGRTETAHRANHTTCMIGTGTRKHEMHCTWHFRNHCSWLCHVEIVHVRSRKRGINWHLNIELYGCVGIDTRSIAKGLRQYNISTLQNECFKQGDISPSMGPCKDYVRPKWVQNFVFVPRALYLLFLWHIKWKKVTDEKGWVLIFKEIPLAFWSFNSSNIKLHARKRVLSRREPLRVFATYQIKRRYETSGWHDWSYSKLRIRKP